MGDLRARLCLRYSAAQRSPFGECVRVASAADLVTVQLQMEVEASRLRFAAKHAKRRKRTGRTGPKVRFDARFTFFASLWPPSRFLARTISYFYDDVDDDKNIVNNNTTNNVNNDGTNSTNNTAKRAARGERGEGVSRSISPEDTGYTGDTGSSTTTATTATTTTTGSTGSTRHGTVDNGTVDDGTLNGFWSLMSFLTDPSEEEVAAVVRTNSQ